MEKINNVVKSPIAPKTTNAIWINTEDNTVNVFDEHQGWIQVSGGSISIKHQTTSTTIQPNVWNVWDPPVSILTITKGTDTEGKVNEYIVKFTIDSLAETPQIVFDGWSLLWNGGNEPTWTAGNTYEINIVDNIAVYAEIEPE